MRTVSRARIPNVFLLDLWLSPVFLLRNPTSRNQMDHIENSGDRLLADESGFCYDKNIDSQGKAPYTLNLQASALVGAAQIDSRAPAAVHIPTQSPALVPQFQQPLGVPIPSQLDVSVPTEVSDHYRVPPQMLATPFGSNIDAALPTPQPSTSSLDPNLAAATTKYIEERALVSCHSCRSAKIRCDRVQPACRNCTERHTVCTYEDSVRRRGPDKNPRTRTRKPVQNADEKQTRAHPYKAARPKKNTAKLGHRVEPTPLVANALDTNTNSGRAPHAAIDPPSFSAPGPIPLHTTPGTTQQTTSSISPDSQLKPYNPRIYRNGLKLPVQHTYHQTWSPCTTALRISPVSQLPSVSTSKTHDQASRDSPEPTEYEVKFQLLSDDHSIGKEPSLHFSQDTWWDTILSIYDPTSKSRAARLATADLHEFFQTSSAWLYFVNVPLFFNMFYDPGKRAMMQPSLVLSCLAYSVHTRGSESEGGEEQRRQALQLRDFGQAAFDASYNAGWIDIPLAQASWMLALLESCVHPESSMARMGSSLMVMDSVISVLGLTSMDAENFQSPTVFTGTIPAIGRRNHWHFEVGTTMPSVERGQRIQAQLHRHSTQLDSDRQIIDPSPSASTSRGCPCGILSMQNELDPLRSTPMWMLAPRWDQDAHFGVLRRDEARRLVWSALRLVGGEVNRRLSTGTPLLDLELAKLTNFAVLYPGENLYYRNKDILAAYSSKESTWALYSRAVHLWVACTTHHNVALTPHDKADFATRTWMETIAIEEALDSHHCDGERATMFQARENIFNIRMFISDMYRRFIPIPQSAVNFSHLDRRRALHWLQHQNTQVLYARTTAMADLNSYPAKMLVRRPFLIWWQLSQIWRALALFDMDNTLTLAVDVILNILPMFSFMQKMWPCAQQRMLAQPLMERVRVACQKTGKTLPSLFFSS